MTAPRTPPRGLSLFRLGGPILLIHLYQSCAFAVLAWPVLEATRASGIAQLPEPAQQLFSEGALWLLELLQQQKSSLKASLVPGLWLLGVVCCVGLVPEWWLIRAIVEQRTGRTEPARPVLARLAGLGLVVWLLRIPGWLSLAILASLVPPLAALSDERSADLLLFAALGVTLLFQLGVSLLRDLAALDVVAGRRSARATSRHVLRWVRERSLRLTARYAAVRALSLGTWLGGELLLFALPSSATADASVGFSVHQLALFLRIVLHAAWLVWLARQLEP